MSWTDPWPTNDLERRGLEQGLSELVGQRIRTVRYLLPSTSDDRSTGDREDVHEVSMGLELETSSAVFVLAWKMKGVLEGLSFGLFPQMEYERSSRVAAFDMSGVGQWQRRLGSPIVQVGGSWHVPEDGCPETLWSIRLLFESGEVATACLGEIGEAGRLRYQPDGLLVLFAREIAEEFRIPAGTASAWGRRIAGTGC